MFSVTFDRLLGFIISHHGLEIDHSKIKAIAEILALRKEKEVRGFLGRLNYIGHFIARLTTTCKPLFKLEHPSCVEQGLP